MNLLKYYQQYRDKWWALPLVLPALLLPVARWANTYTMLNGHMVFLYYLPLALVLSLMMFFGWAAIPGIIIGLLLTLAHGMMFSSPSVYCSISLSPACSAGAATAFLSPSVSRSHTATSD